MHWFAKVPSFFYTKFQPLSSKVLTYQHFILICHGHFGFLICFLFLIVGIQHVIFLTLNINSKSQCAFLWCFDFLPWDPPTWSIARAIFNYIIECSPFAKNYLACSFSLFWTNWRCRPQSSLLPISASILLLLNSG